MLWGLASLACPFLGSALDLNLLWELASLACPFLGPALDPLTAGGLNYVTPCRPLFSILVIAKINHVRGRWFIILANIGWRKSNLYVCAEFRSHFSTKKHLPTHTCIMRSVILKFPSVCGESFEKCMFVRYCYIVYSLPLKKDCGTPSIRRTYVRHTDHFDHLRNTSYLEHNYMYDYTTN